jgi:hypothetical protein
MWARMSSANITCLMKFKSTKSFTDVTRRGTSIETFKPMCPAKIGCVALGEVGGEDLWGVAWGGGADLLVAICESFT